MAEDKRTQMGTGPLLAQPDPAQRATPAGTPVPSTSPPASASMPGAATAYLPTTGSPANATPAPQSAPPGSAPPAANTSYLPPTEDPLIGQTLIGRYAISKKLGEGGMGAVYLATHTLLDKQVALKVLHGEFLRKADLVERFMQEAKSASRIRHENVIDISDFGTTPEGLVFFAMEMLVGHDLHEEISRARLAGQLLPWARSKRIFLQICGALSAAHGLGIVHRDLKPENIYLIDRLNEPDFVKLLDFGIAKLTEGEEGGRKLTKTGMLFGTPEYMSPEQARGEQVDHRVDIYAMGCILFQLVTGRVPFEADNFMGVLSMHLTEPPPAIPLEVFDRIGAPRELAAVIDRALLKDRNQRWNTIDELANAVRTVCGDPIPTGNTGVVQVPRAPSVAAPANTTESRQRTQWTGNLSVPTEDDARTGGKGGKSKLPLIIGGVVIAAGAAVAAMFALKGGGGSSSAAGSGEASGSSAIIAGSGSQIAAAPPDAAPPPPPADAALAPLPEMVKVRIDSKPHGAEVYDLATNKRLGKTPLNLNIGGSHDKVTFKVTRRGFADSIFELTPDQDLNYVATLEKGVAGQPTRPTVGAGSATVKPDQGSGAITKPDQGSGAVVKPDPKPDDDCPPDEFPCLKTNVDLKGPAPGSGG